MNTERFVGILTDCVNKLNYLADNLGNLLKDRKGREDIEDYIVVVSFLIRVVIEEMEEGR